jgi:hypothetical protein
MSKIATLLGCVFVLTCTMAIAQKRPATPGTPSSGSSCAGPLTTKGKTGPQTCKAGSSGNNPSSMTTVPANASMLGRLANQRLKKATPRPGTPGFLPASTTVSATQLP